MRVIVLGGDGYLGWPTAMHLGAAGHDVWAVDNYLRRRIAQEPGSEALVAYAGLGIWALFDGMVTVSQIKVVSFVLAAVLACIRHDGHIGIAELELFRAIAATLGCPVPPAAAINADT